MTLTEKNAVAKPSLDLWSTFSLIAAAPRLIQPLRTETILDKHGHSLGIVERMVLFRKPSTLLYAAQGVLGEDEVVATSTTLERAFI